MTTGIAALILLAIAFALIVSGALAIPRRRKQEAGLLNLTPEQTDDSAEVESELLRRPLRSRYNA